VDEAELEVSELELSELELSDDSEALDSLDEASPITLSSSSI
jgi:hypothetical protein